MFLSRCTGLCWAWHNDPVLWGWVLLLHGSIWTLLRIHVQVRIDALTSTNSLSNNYLRVRISNTSKPQIWPPTRPNYRVFWPSFRCCTHLKAGLNAFLAGIKCFFLQMHGGTLVCHQAHIFELWGPGFKSRQWSIYVMDRMFCMKGTASVPKSVLR